MRVGRKLVTILCIVILALLAFGCQSKKEAPKEGAQTEPAKKTQIRIAGGGPGSTVYLAGGAMAEFLRTKSNLPNITATAQTTGGFLENVRLVERGDTELGITASSMMYEALNQKGSFKAEKPYQNIQVLFPVWWGGTHWVTFRDDIKTMADLKGKRVNVGPPGSSAITYAEMTLKGANIWDDVKRESQNWDEGVRLMQDDMLHAFTVTGPIPFPAAQEAATVHGRKLNFISIGDNVLQNIFKTNPEMLKVVIPKDSYGPGIPAADYPTCGYIGYTIINKKVSEDVAYEITKALLSDAGKKFMVDSVVSIKTGMDILPGFEAVESVGMKMHPGAVKYWKEKGVTVPSKIIP